ncbi:helix-turn-helix domain-containing protein [Ensifer sp. LCM 4579]|uniref:helix-turn-helix domain-containing protein n=1 Tax=Ensifer sp. LCM 4579 TaxID=1848292 RepID=UPI0008D90F36|nr:AraC family transcriptional regulator [Ensifer sp. LCM 4579]OHV84006.1 AraC family transcriptional regulator [Ensifer sp. LCM 4579]
MGGNALADTTVHVRRLQGGVSPPVVPEAFSGDTRLVGRWHNKPFEYDLPALEDHILSATYAGTGTASVKIGRQTISAPARSGMITFWPRGHKGFWRVDGAVEVSNAFLGRSRLVACSDQVGNGREPDLLGRVHFSDPKLFTIMRLINDEVSSGDAISHLFIEQLLDLVCLQLLRAHSSTSVPISPGPRRGLSNWQVKRVTTYIREHLAENIRLQELADLVNLSRFHFCTAFRTATGHTPYGWLTRQRIAYAKTLLKDRTLRIIDIALIVGYETQSSFSASFRKVVGLTPSEFRRRL